MDFTKENGDLLLKILQNGHPDHVIMNEWKNQIFEKLGENLRKEGFDQEQILKVAEAVWTSFDL